MPQHHILLIEDDATLATILEQKLVHEGYRVSLAADGMSGIALLKKQPPDMVLLDIMMPVMDGYQVLEELRKDQDPRVANVPVIIVSNSGQPVEIGRAMAFGIKDYFVKASFDPDQVLAKIQKHLLGTSQAESAPLSMVQAQDSAPNIGNNGISLLIVEDDKFLRDLEIAKLTKEGFQVASAQDGEQGVALAASVRPRIILLDILLPGIDGFEVLTRLAQSPDFPNMKVIMLSNFGQREDIERAEKLGAVKFLIKANYTLDEIVDEVKQVAATM